MFNSSNKFHKREIDGTYSNNLTDFSYLSTHKDISVNTNTVEAFLFKKCTQYKSINDELYAIGSRFIQEIMEGGLHFMGSDAPFLDTTRLGLCHVLFTDESRFSIQGDSRLLFI